MTLPVDELTRELTPDEVKASLYRIQEALGLSTTSWVAGSVVRVINTAVSYLGAGFSRLVVTLNQSAFLDTAREGWLSRRVVDTYGEEVARLEAIYARGELTIDNAGGGIYEFEPGELIVQNGITEATYANVATVNVGALQTGVTAIFEATELGAASSAAATHINTVVTAAPGLSVSNVAAFLGRDAETDSAYLVRARESSGRLSPNGPSDAYRFVAKSSTRNGKIALFDPTGEVIDVNRVWVSTGVNPVIVRVASSQGAVAGDKDTPGTDVAHIQTSLDTYVTPNAVESEAYSAAAQAVPVTATIYVRKEIGESAASIQAAIETKLTAFFATSPIGGWVLPGDPDGYVFKNMILGVIESLEIDGIANAESYVIKADVAAPAADVGVAETDVPIAGVFTITVVLV